MCIYYSYDQQVGGPSQEDFNHASDVERVERTSLWVGEQYTRLHIYTIKKYFTKVRLNCS